MNTHPQIILRGSSATGAYQIIGYTYSWLKGMDLEFTGTYYRATDKYYEKHDYIKNIIFQIILQNLKINYVL